MLKRIIFSIVFLASLYIVSAQHVPGSWKVIPMTGTSFEFVQDTPGKVYFLSSGSLYSFDKETSETMYYTPGSKISDSSIKFLKYNGDKKYVALVYNNGNIDLIYDNGKVVNLSEIKDSNLTMAKAINDIQFGEDRIYVATSFGIVVYDDKDYYVVESGIYNENIPVVFEMGDYVMLWRKDSDGKMKLAYSSKKDRHNTADKFKVIKELGYDNVMPVRNNEFMMLSNGNLTKYTVDFSAPVESMLTSSSMVTGTGGKKINKYKEGWFVPGTNGFYMVDKDGKYTEKISYDASYGSQNLSFWANPSTFWAGNADGIGSYTLSNGVATPLNAKFFPKSSKQFHTWYATNTLDGKRVYISEAARTQIVPEVGGNNEFFDAKLYHEYYDWESGEFQEYYPYNEWGIFGGGSSRVVFNSNDPSIVYVGSLFWGLCVFDKDGKVIAQYDDTCTPLNSRWGSQIYDMAFDNNGNLWMIMWLINSNPVDGSVASPVKILTKEGFDLIKSDPQAIKVKDGGKYWLQPKWVDGLLGWMDAKLIFSSKTNKGIALNGAWGCPFVGMDTKGTTDINDDVYFQYSGFRDQDGTVTNPIRKSWIIEDKNGHIWIGTDTGIYIVKDLDQICDGSSNYLEVIRPKVARNDGTNYADYLLSSDMIMNIAVDSNNRKWIATTTSGLYLVNEDGTEILQEFNMDNSPLVSNVVTMVTCDPYGNDVLIGTPEGLFVYSSDSAPAKDDYSEVYAYPNPVRPDYTGWITINGLMDNSLIKITDSQGSVVWSGRSEGGMAVWDGCDSNGNRVRSGVYMVMASQNENGNSGAVTKIVVVN